MGPGIAPGPHSRSPSHVRLGDCRFRVGGGGSPSIRSGDCSPAIWAARPSAEAWVWAIRRNRSGGPKGPATIVRPLAGVDRFPRARRRSAAGFPRERSGQSPDGACFRRVSVSGRSLQPSSASASAGGCPPTFPRPARCAFPSGPKTFMKNVAAAIERPHRMRNLSSLFKGLRPDPQRLSRSRQLDAALRSRVAQAPSSRVIHSWPG